MRNSEDFFVQSLIYFWYHITSQELRAYTARKEKTGCISTPGLFLILRLKNDNLNGANQVSAWFAQDWR